MDKRCIHGRFRSKCMWQFHLRSMGWSTRIASWVDARHHARASPVVPPLGFHRRYSRRCFSSRMVRIMGDAARLNHRLDLASWLNPIDHVQTTLPTTVSSTPFRPSRRREETKAGRRCRAPFLATWPCRQRCGTNHTTRKGHDEFRILTSITSSVGCLFASLPRTCRPLTRLIPCHQRATRRHLLLSLALFRIRRTQCNNNCRNVPCSPCQVQHYPFSSTNDQ